MHAVLNAARVAVAGAMALSVAACWGNASESPPIHLQQNMDFQERGDTQELSGFFTDLRVMRKPPAGTVAQGFLKDDDHLYRGKNLDGTIADALPAGIELDEALLRRGEDRYGIYCAPCHDESGRGHGPATRRGGGMAVEPVNLHMAKLQPAPLGYFFQVMTLGKGQMRPYAAQVTPEDRWAIAAWIRVLQLSHRAEEKDIPAGALTTTARRQP
jgi:mono/diheme cytochrome c family protein